MDFIELLPFVTTQISVTTHNGTTGFGTGFFFAFEHQQETEEMSYAPLLITNRHVVKDVAKMTITITRKDGDGPKIGDAMSLSFDNTECPILLHPDPSVDLVAIMIGSIIQQYTNSLFIPYFSVPDLPTENELRNINVMHDIIMIGYPDSISDEVNHMPIFRKGITATRPDLNYDGKKTFLIDASCFPGSSGSPVLSYDNGIYQLETKDFTIGNQIKLIGIQSATFIHNSTGNIVPIEIPTQIIPGITVQIPNNLGIVVRSTCILDFKPLLPLIPR